MNSARRARAAVLLLISSAASIGWAQATHNTLTLNVTAMPKWGTVDEQFQSYNIEMVEVTGGRFWKPYASAEQKAPGPPGDAAHGNQPAGLAADLFQYRPPIDLSNTRLRKLAAALGPAYLRVSGTWANSTYFDPEGRAGSKAPAGFQGVLTGAEWRGVLEFANAAHAGLVTSFAVSAGTRDAAGAWTPAEAEKVAAFTKAASGQITAAELINEPTFPEIDGLGKSYDAAAFARDIATFRSFAKKSLPDTLLLGPGGVAEGVSMMAAPPGMQGPRMLSSTDLLKATGPVFDVFSYHSYGAVSIRCNPRKSTNLDDALSADTLNKAAQITRYYAGLRDELLPGKPLWNTETAEAACGGDTWAAEFADSFRYLAQLGDLARSGVHVNMYNTLAASDYGLLNENSYEPRPNYWAALLWRRLMGSTVLDAGPDTGQANLHVYAHCLRGVSGGVALLAINADRSAAAEIHGLGPRERYSLTAKTLDAKEVELNGKTLTLGSGDSLPELKGKPEAAVSVRIEPLSITFLTFPAAANTSCR